MAGCSKNERSRRRVPPAHGPDDKALRGDSRLFQGTKRQDRCLGEASTRRLHMPAILMWLMGVPLIVIVLLYLLF